MRAWVVGVPVAVEACGGCRTDRHLAEGALAPQHHRVVPGHEVVGRVVRHGPGAPRCALGDRVAIAAVLVVS